MILHTFKAIKANKYAIMITPGPKPLFTSEVNFQGMSVRMDSSTSCHIQVSQT